MQISLVWSWIASDTKKKYSAMKKKPAEKQILLAMATTTATGTICW